MKEKLPKIFLILTLVLILVNLGYLDYNLFWDKKINKTEIQIEEKNGGSQECSLNCQTLIDQKINEALAKIPTFPPQKTLSLVIPTSAPAIQAKATYIPLVSEGTTVNTTWTDIVPSEFWFDLTDYPAAKEVRFICYLQALHGSAKVYARLYDKTNERAVDYSQVETQSDSYVRLESSGITIWRGNNKYTVQLKSENGTQVLLKEAKLKIIF